MCVQLSTSVSLTLFNHPAREDHRHQQIAGVVVKRCLLSGILLGGVAAAQMDGQELGGRWLKITMAIQKPKPDGCTTVFIGNLSWPLDEVTD